MADEELDESEVELDDDEFEGDIDVDVDVDDDFDEGSLDDDLEIEADVEDEEKPRGRSSSDDDFASLDYEQMLKVNPKRAKMLRKRARRIEGILDDAELETPKGAARAWEKLNESTDTDVRREYSVTDEYSENDVLEHPKFGLGFVVEIKSDRKLSALFEDGLRRLVHNVPK